MGVANVGQVYEPVKEKLRLAALEINEDSLVSINSVYAFLRSPFIHLSCLFLCLLFPARTLPHRLNFCPHLPKTRCTIYEILPVLDVSKF